MQHGFLILSELLNSCSVLCIKDVYIFFYSVLLTDSMVGMPPVLTILRYFLPTPITY